MWRREHGGAAEPLRAAAAALRDQGEGAAAGGAAQRRVRAVLPRAGGRAAQGRAARLPGPRLRRRSRPGGGVQRQGAAGPGAGEGAGGPAAGRGPAPLLPHPPLPGALSAPGAPGGRAALPDGAEGRPGGGAGGEGGGWASRQGEGRAGVPQNESGEGLRGCGVGRLVIPVHCVTEQSSFPQAMAPAGAGFAHAAQPGRKGAAGGVK